MLCPVVKRWLPQPCHVPFCAHRAVLVLHIGTAFTELSVLVSPKLEVFFLRANR